MVVVVGSIFSTVADVDVPQAATSSSSPIIGSANFITASWLNASPAEACCGLALRARMRPFFRKPS